MVHKTFFIIDTLFHWNHGFRSGDPCNIIDTKNNVFSMMRITGPNLTKNIEFSSSDVRNGDEWNRIELL